MAFNDRIPSLLLALFFLLSTFSSCLAHYCKCECNMGKSKSHGTGFSDTTGSPYTPTGSPTSPSGSAMSPSTPSSQSPTPPDSGGSTAPSTSPTSGSPSGPSTAPSSSSGGSSPSANSPNSGTPSSPSSAPSSSSGGSISPTTSPNSGSPSAAPSSGGGSMSGSGSGSSSGGGSMSGSGSSSSGGSMSGSTGSSSSGGSMSGSGSGSSSSGGSMSGSAGSSSSGGSMSGSGSGSSSGGGSMSGSSSSGGSMSGSAGSSSGGGSMSGSAGSSSGGGSMSGSGSSSGGGSMSGSGSTSSGGSMSGSGSSYSGGSMSGSSSSWGSVSGSGGGSMSGSGSFGSNANFSGMYAFGDSFTDTGNAGIMGGLTAFAQALAPHSPYGSTFKPPSFRFSDGRVLIDFITEALHLPYLPPVKNTSADFSKGCNFAVGGSSAFPGKFFEDHNVGRTLMWKQIPNFFKNQEDWFNQFLNNVQCKGLEPLQCKAKIARAIFWVGETAFNDYLRNFGSSTTIQSLMEKLVDVKVNLVKSIIDKGGKFLIVQGLPPLGCFPLHMSMAASGDRDENGCAKSANSIIKAHNDHLLKKIGELKVQFPNCLIAYADFFNAFLNIFKNAKQLGFVEPFKACCGSGSGLFHFNLHCLCGATGSTKCPNPAAHISWDGIHLTEAMHKKIADMFLNQGFLQPPFKQFIAAAAQAH